jgi:hypothetical protein
MQGVKGKIKVPRVEKNIVISWQMQKNAITAVNFKSQSLDTDKKHPLIKSKKVIKRQWHTSNY